MKEKIKHLLQREFDLVETVALIRIPINVYWSWGVEKLYHVEQTGLILKVNGHHWKHYVLITLAWNDTYIVSLLDAEFNPVKTIKDIYFESLQTTIDKEIEYIELYDGEGI